MSFPAAAEASISPAVVSTRDAAVYLGVSLETLQRWRHNGIGPAYIRPGETKGRVVYLIADLDNWLDSRRVQPKAASAAADNTVGITLSPSL